MGMDKKKILLVEDDDNLRELYSELLTQENYDVTTAEDGTKGLMKVQQGNWDLVLMDLILPEMNGFDIVRKAKENPQVVYFKKIIFLTNLYTDDQLKEATELGGGYLIKGNITPDQLLTEVKKNLS